jgi:hypothetical protein
MIPAVGQRWLWSVNEKSISIIEITKMNSDSYFYYIYVQIIKHHYHCDKIGIRGSLPCSILNCDNTCISLTYMIGQDSPGVLDVET